MAFKLVVFSCLLAIAHGSGVPAVTYAAPAAVAARLEEFDPFPTYNFGYNVADSLTGDYKSQNEQRNGDLVQGQYSLVEPDGTRRVVDYSADSVNGFNAVVRNVPLVAASPAVVAEPAVVPARLAAAPVAVAQPAPVVTAARFTAAPAFARYAAAPAAAAVAAPAPVYARYAAAPVAAAPAPVFARYTTAPVAAAPLSAAPVAAAPAPVLARYATAPVVAQRYATPAVAAAYRAAYAAPFAAYSPYAAFTAPFAAYTAPYATRVAAAYTSPVAYSAPVAAPVAAAYTAAAPTAVAPAPLPLSWCRSLPLPGTATLECHTLTQRCLYTSKDLICIYTNSSIFFTT